MPKKRGNNEGSITKRSDGRWMARVTVGRDPETGQLKRVSFYGKTRQEVADAMSKALSDKSRGFVKPIPPRTSQYHKVLKIKHLGPLPIPLHATEYHRFSPGLVSGWCQVEWPEGGGGEPFLGLSFLLCGVKFPSGGGRAAWYNYVQLTTLGGDGGRSGSVPFPPAPAHLRERGASWTSHFFYTHAVPGKGP